MPIWGTSASGVFTCPHCRARYAVSHVHSPVPKKGQAQCIACNRTMSEWHSSAAPRYTLIERPSRQ
jgi:predicted Zn finger-like uncharacterized protein